MPANTSAARSTSRTFPTAVPSPPRRARKPASPEPASPEPVVPNDRDTERYLLGAILKRNGTIFEEVAALVQADDFYRDAHRLIFSAFARIRERGDAIDLSTLTIELNAFGHLADAGGVRFINHLDDGVVGTNYKTQAEGIKELSLQRARIALREKALEAERNGDTEAVRGFEDELRQHQAAAVVGSVDLSQTLDELTEGDDGQVQMRVAGLLPGHGIVLAHGHPRTMKSWALLDIGVTVAHEGLKALGLLPVAQHCPVVYVTNEDSPAVVRGRAKEICQGYGVDYDPERLRFLVHRLDGEGDAPALDMRSQQDRLIAIASRWKAGIVILDTLRSLTAYVDKGPSDIQPFGMFLRRLMKETGAMVVMSHHDVKPGNQPDGRDRGQRISGGGLLSISDFPIHFESLEEGRSRLVPHKWKGTLSPAPLDVTLNRVEGETASFTAHHIDGAEAEMTAIQSTILEIVRTTSGLSGGKVAEKAGVTPPTARAALQALATAGRVTFTEGTNKAHHWSVVEHG